MKKIFTTFLLTATLTACATKPDEIQAAYVSPLKYASYTCEQLGTEMGYVGEKTTRLYSQLDKKAKDDNTQGWIGAILFWPALFFLEGGDGPEAAEYAQLKGDFEALRQNSVQKNCSVKIESPEEIIKRKAAEEKAAKKAKKEARRKARNN
jgi:hypothetical protein